MRGSILKQSTYAAFIKASLLTNTKKNIAKQKDMQKYGFLPSSDDRKIRLPFGNEMVIGAIDYVKSLTF